MTTIAFVMDPIDSLALKKDSTLAMIRAVQRRGWDVVYLRQEDLFYRDAAPWGIGRRLELTSPFVDELNPAVIDGPWYTLSEPTAVALGDLDVIMMRKDPPFDMEYVYSTYLLERAQQQGALVVNDPRAIRDCNEKFFATAFPDCQPELVVSRSLDVLIDFHREIGNVVFKPLDGMGGKSIFRVLADDPNLRVILETLTDGGTQQIMGQRYIPEIVDGDKRILLIDGEPVPYALARIPMVGESRGNLAAGGSGEGRPLTDRDRWIAEQVGPELRARGLTFVGIDVIGAYLTEVNVTCPTCIRELDAQFSLDIGDMLISRVAAKLS